MNPQSTNQTPQTLPDTIPITEAHNYLPALHNLGATGSLLPDTIPLNDAHTYLPMIQSFGSANSSPSGTPVTPQASGDKGANESKIAQAGAATFGPNEVAPLLAIVNSESGFNDKAANKTSSARGLFQFLASTARNYGLPEDATQASPDQQIQAGLQYIKSRYGTPSAAWQFHQQHNWY